MTWKCIIQIKNIDHILLFYAALMQLEIQRKKSST